MLFNIWFAEACGPGNREALMLLEHFDTAYDIYTAGEGEIQSLVRSYRLRRALADKSLERARVIYDYCQLNRITIYTYWDEQYPMNLRNLQDPPVLLYCKGAMPHFNGRLYLSIVGTRSMTEYGKRMAYKIGYELASAGVVVVSGLALGNDSMAAAGAILSGGTTVAVLGCGLDRVYPPEHTNLAAAVERQGAVVTEFSPGTPPIGTNFPIRNRLISGLSRGTIVVEGDKRSGALITARHAILQGREIYAVPGNVGERSSEGSNQLIADGAAAIFSARDVLEHYTFLYDDVLDMTRFRKAEKTSTPDDAVLADLGVYTRAVPTAKTDVGETSPKSARPSKASVESRVGTRKKKAAPKADKTEQTVQSHVEKAPSQPGKSEANRPTGDASDRVLATLGDTQRRIFEALPLDRAVTVDYLVREGFSMSDIMASLTILEISGLVVTLPGGLYTRR